MVETWIPIKQFQDILLDRTEDGVAKITINRPEVRNAFRPQTVSEIKEAFEICREETRIGVVILTGQGLDAFCSGGDQKVRGHAGYVGADGVPRLNILDVQKQIRALPKPVIAMVAGYAIGGGHVLHVVCDLTIAADNARFGQTGPKVGSFDGGLGSSYLARIVGQKKAREIWYLCRQYDARQALDMGLVNHVVPLAELEAETMRWAREMLEHSPIALRCLKAALNADCDGQIGLLDLAGNATLLYYMSEEAKEGKQAFVEHRKPDFSQFPAPAMTTRARALWLTARPKTLTACLAPVLVGTALVWAQGGRPDWRITLFALLSSAMLQIGTNFVNDALDFIKGADGEARLGEARATQQGWFTARGVMIMGLSCFAAAMLFGLPLVYTGGWPILAVGLVSLAMGYGYTGGPFPLAYLGLGDLFVVLFFGLVAVGGVYFLHTHTYGWDAVVAGLQVGFLATVLIAVNNLRDLEQDRLVNKRTLAVRLGPKLGRLEVLLLILLAFGLNLYWLNRGMLFAFALPLFALPLAMRVVQTLLKTEASREYNSLLGRAAMVHLLFGVLMSAGFFLQ